MAAPYPLVTFHFLVEWGGTRVSFTEVTGLSTDVDKIDYRSGDSPAFHVTKLSGLQKYSDITLKRGMVTSDNEFFQWLTNVKMNIPDRRTITIKLLDETHSPVFTWTVANAWPMKVEGPAFNATTSSFAVESVTLVCESFVLEAN
jgi:phage tail-like protein